MKVRISFLTIAFLLFSFCFSKVHAATINVTETQDGFMTGVCTLRQAVQQINLQTDGNGCTKTAESPAYGTDDTIVLLGETYVLSIGPSQAVGSDNSAGDLDFERDLSIVGAGMDVTVITASGFPSGDTDRVMQVNSTCGGGNNTCPQSLTLLDLTVRDGNSDDDGGGIFARFENNQSTLTLERVAIRNNHSDDDGGGLDLFGTLVMSQSIVDGNSSNDDGGGARLFGDLSVIVNSTFSLNRAGTTNPVPTAVQPSGIDGFGGGIFNGSPLVMINSTVSGNFSQGDGGGINLIGPGSQGNSPIQSMFFNVTIAHNQILNPSFRGGGINFESISEEGGTVSDTVSLYNTLLARNTAAIGPDCGGDFISGGFNLITDVADCTGFGPGTNDQTDVGDAFVGLIQNNGGPTPTNPLIFASPAIDRGNDQTGCMAPNVDELINNQSIQMELLTQDQRFFTRPIAVRNPDDPICDVGAVEFQTFDFTVTKEDNVNGVAPLNSQFTYTITVTNQGSSIANDVLLNDPLPSQVSFNSVTSTQGTCSGVGNTVSCNLGSLDAGETATVEVIVTVQATGTFENIVIVTAEGFDSFSVITKEAQTTTQAGSSIFASGSGCSIKTPPTVPGSKAMAWIILSSIVVIWGYRRRANQSL